MKSRARQDCKLAREGARGRGGVTRATMASPLGGGDWGTGDGARCGRAREVISPAWQFASALALSLSLSPFLRVSAALACQSILSGREGFQGHRPTNYPRLIDALPSNAALLRPFAFCSLLSAPIRSSARIAAFICAILGLPAVSRFYFGQERYNLFPFLFAACPLEDSA